MATSCLVLKICALSSLEEERVPSFSPSDEDRLLVPDSSTGLTHYGVTGD